MICSKIDTLKADRRNACDILERMLSTPRGTSEAREEAMLRRHHALKTKTCSGCNRDEAHIGSDGYCSLCSAAIKRMLVFKSNLAVEWPGSKRISRFVDDYMMVVNLPYSLRGNANKEDVLVAAKHLLHIVTELEALNRQTRRREDK